MVMDAELLKTIETMRLYGDNTRSDTREEFRREDGVEDHWLAVSVYRPCALADGTRCLVRTLKKSRRGAWLYKIVIVPDPIQLSEEMLPHADPGNFWEMAYWRHLANV